MGWIAFDLDRTLAKYDRWRGAGHVGEPIMSVLNRLKRYLEEGKECRIFTARVASAHHPAEVAEARTGIDAWCDKWVGRRLAITAEKDMDMIELWDDRAVAVEPNTGKQLSPSRYDVS
jgi:hypothetical protein